MRLILTVPIALALLTSLISVAETNTFNGITANGLTWNGLAANGLAANGLTWNGLSVNALTLNGLEANGVNPVVRQNSCANVYVSCQMSSHSDSEFRDCASSFLAEKHVPISSAYSELSYDEDNDALITCNDIFLGCGDRAMGLDDFHVCTDSFAGHSR